MLAIPQPLFPASSRPITGRFFTSDGVRLLAAGIALSLGMTSCALPEKSFRASAEPVKATPGADVLYSTNVDPSLFPTNLTEVPEDELEMGNTSGLRPKFGVTAGVTADDNLYLDPRDPVSDVEFTVSPHVSIGVGDTREFKEDYAQLEYKPTAHVFVENTSENDVDHDAAVKLQRSLGKLRTRGEGRFQSLSGANREVGSRVDQNAYQANVEAAYAATGKINVGARAGFRNDDYQESTLANTSDRYAEGFGDYAITGKTSVGLGGRVGNIKTDGAPNQDYSQAFVRAESKIGGKLSVSARAGLDSREVEGSNDVNPILEAALQYQPRAGTSVQISPYQALNASTISPGESYIRTGVTASVKQKLGSKFYVKLDGGYEKAEYNAATTPAGAQKREDDYFFVRPALGYEFKEGMSAEIYYRRSENSSSDAEFTYDANQVGAGVNIQY